MKIAKAPQQIKREMKYDLDKFNISSLNSLRAFAKILFIIWGLLCFICGIILISQATQQEQITYGLILIFVSPVFIVFTYMFLNMYISMAYDIKIIKYTMLYAKENINDKNLKIPEELTNEQEYQIQDAMKQSQNANDE